MVRKVAGPSEYLAITGSGITDIKLSKKAWIWPFQKCVKFDVSPVNYTFQLISPHDKLSHHVTELVQGVIAGETRVLAASMTMEEVFKGTKEFKKELVDVPGHDYFSYLGQKTQMEAANQAKPLKDLLLSHRRNQDKLRDMLRVLFIKRYQFSLKRKAMEIVNSRPNGEKSRKTKGRFSALVASTLNV
ncbi:unnamed protein product [Dovyalis caffra]|uniref:Flotillin-like n=1 Tax=Dovyalis caffra TaxID=77055 RepID=A0AAV1S399_9ROSI|nr:unnamed protein product [Dovyalis caffra]